MTPSDPRRDPSHVVLDGLRRDAEAAPDLTGRVMGRLGYMRVAPAVRARRRRRRFAGRAFAALSMLGLIVLVASMLDAAGRTRTPEGPTIGEAVGLDLAVRREQFAGTFAGLRRLGERLGEAADAAPVAPAAAPAAARSRSNGEVADAPSEALGPVSDAAGAPGSAVAPWC